MKVFIAGSSPDFLCPIFHSWSLVCFLRKLRDHPPCSLPNVRIHYNKHLSIRRQIVLHAEKNTVGQTSYCRISMQIVGNHSFVFFCSQLAPNFKLTFSFNRVHRCLHFFLERYKSFCQRICMYQICSFPLITPTMAQIDNAIYLCESEWVPNKSLYFSTLFILFNEEQQKFHGKCGGWSGSALFLTGA